MSTKISNDTIGNQTGDLPTITRLPARKNPSCNMQYYDLLSTPSKSQLTGVFSPKIISFSLNLKNLLLSAITLLGSAPSTLHAIKFAGFTLGCGWINHECLFSHSLTLLVLRWAGQPLPPQPQ